MKKPPYTRPGGKAGITYDRYYQESNCNVEIFTDSEGLRAVQISFSGKARLFPSTSNGRNIAYSKKKKQLFLSKNPSQQGRLAAARDLYYDALDFKKLELPKFGEVPVMIDIVLAESGYLRDSHNHAKPIADWLEEVDMIDDDRWAEIHCTKKKDYDFPMPSQTEILITRFDLCKEINATAVKNRFFAAKCV